MGFSHVIKHSALDVVDVVIADDMTHWEFICAQPANAFFPHTHTDIFWICQRFFVVFSFWIFQKRCEAASLGHKSIKCRHNTQRTQRATSTAAAALPAAAAATWQAGVAAKRACGGGVTEERLGGEGLAALHARNHIGKNPCKHFQLKIALPFVSSLCHISMCARSRACVWVCVCVAVCGVCTDVSVSLVLALVPVYLSNVANCLSITITVKH